VEAVLNVLGILSYFDFKHSIRYIEIVLEADYYNKVLASALSINDKIDKLDQRVIDEMELGPTEPIKKFKSPLTQYPIRELI